MKKELISIIVPIYNSSSYLKNCLQCLINQTYKNIEIILIDDGSTDDSYKICSKIKKKDNRIKLFSKKNGGAAAAKNLGIKKSKGTYICFVDSDDLVSYDYVDYLYNLIIKSKCDMSVACYTVKSGKKEYNIGKNQSSKQLTNRECLKKILLTDGITVSLCAKMYKRELLVKNLLNEGFPYEDDGAMYKLILQCNNISYGNKSIYTYFVRNQSVMTKCFSTDRLILLKYAKNMKEIILESYPDLNEFVEKKYIEYNFSILRQITQLSCNISDDLKVVKTEIIKYLKSNSGIILKSKIYSFREKIAIFTLIFGEKFYKFSWKIYTLFKY